MRLPVVTKRVPALQASRLATVLATALVLVLAGCHGDAPPPAPLGYDAGSSVDGAVAPDSGTDIDAGDAPDSGSAIDAGDIADAGTAVDAGGTDAGTVMIDAGTPVDAGPMSDAGLMCPPTAPMPCAGFCKNLQTDRFNCGACGMACSRSQMCCLGTCRIGACL